MSLISFEDYLAIHSLVADYCITIDNADAAGFMDLWVDKNEFGGYESGPFGSMKTWQELYDFEKHHVDPGGMANGKRHQSTNISIKPKSPSEVLVTNALIVLEVAAEPRIIASGRYNDSIVVKTSRGWKFKKRSLHVDTGYFALVERLKSQNP